MESQIEVVVKNPAEEIPDGSSDDGQNGGANGGGSNGGGSNNEGSNTGGDTNGRSRDDVVDNTTEEETDEGLLDDVAVPLTSAGGTTGTTTTGTPGTGRVTGHDGGAMFGVSFAVVLLAAVVILTTVLRRGKRVKLDQRAVERSWLNGREERESWLNGSSKHLGGREWGIGVKWGRVVASGVGVLAVAFFASSIFCRTLAEPEGEASAADSLSLSVTGEKLAVTAAEGGAKAAVARTVTVNSSTSHGYSLYVSTDSARLYRNGQSGETYIGPVSGSAGRLGSLTADTWGISTNGGNTGRAVWMAVPMTETVLYDTTSATKAGMTWTVYLGVNATTKLKSGSYTGTLKFTAVAKEGSDSGDDSGGGSGGDPGDDSGKDDGGGSGGDDSGGGSGGGGGDSGGGDSGGDDSGGGDSGGDEDGDTLADITTMQEMTWEVCEASEVGDQATLKDARDSNSYLVEKLPDEQCWMKENLRLRNVKITAENSNIAEDEYTVPASSEGWGTGSSTAAKVYYNSSNSTAYYSYTAVTGGTADEDGDICPAGWRLPEKSDYGELIASLGGSWGVDKTTFSAMIRNGKGYPYFTQVGWYSGSVKQSGERTAYWGADGQHLWLYDGNGVLYGYLNENGGSGNDNYNKALGKAVRCIADY